MKKHFIISALVVLFAACALSASAEVIRKDVLFNNETNNLPTYTKSQPENTNEIDNCAPPPADMNSFNSYSYSDMSHPAPPSFSSDRPDMPPNMGKNYKKSYRTIYNTNGACK